MKKLFLTVIILLLAINNTVAQGSDVIFCIDNSGSVDNTEYAQMSASVQALITNVLSCNPSNRVAVVHYGTQLIGAPYDGFTPRIFIESNFTNNIATANGFIRRLGSGDFYYESLGLIGNAIDNINNSNIVSTQKTLTRNASNSLVVFLFTDGSRDGGNSFLVNSTSIALNSNPAFQNFTNFKNNRGAKFVVVHVPPSITSQNAAASIASRGGTYNGTIEGYPLDPDGNNLPRFYINNGASFTLSPAQITSVSTDICTIAIVGNISLNPVNENCPLFPQPVIGSYTIPVGATASNITLQVLNSMGAVVSTLINPVVIGNTFTFSLNQINFGTANPMTGNFEFRVSVTVTQGASQTILTSTSSNAGPDVSFDNCSVCCATCCVDNQSLSSPVLANYVDTRQANLRIHAANTINVDAFASYHAGDYVLLKGGFVALAGSRVHVYNEGCSGTYILKQSDSNTNPFPNGLYSENLMITNDIKNDNLLLNNSKTIVISPNPNNGIFKINLKDINEGTIEVTDLYGYIVYKGEFKNQSEFEMNMQDKHQGVYIVKVVSSNETFTGKIIKN